MYMPTENFICRSHGYMFSYNSRFCAHESIILMLVPSAMDIERIVYSIERLIKSPCAFDNICAHTDWCKHGFGHGTAEMLSAVVHMSKSKIWGKQGSLLYTIVHYQGLQAGQACFNLSRYLLYCKMLGRFLKHAAARWARCNNLASK